ncbi:MAG TPA: tetratricopeptide repeat protein [Phycisphaerales bacterium]|nr:tetratricopeptide repeat protein [Phycisphaerales bacterium]
MHDPRRKAMEAWAHLREGRPDRAESVARSITSRAPNDAEANNILAIITGSRGNLVQALHFAGIAARNAPGNPQYRYNLAAVLSSVGKLDESLAEFAKVVELAPEMGDARIGYATALIAKRRNFEAVAQAREALRLAPGEPLSTLVLSQALLHTGESAEAADLLRNTVATMDRPREVLSPLANTLNYAPSITPDELFRVHAALGEKIESQVPRLPPIPMRDAKPLRVGFVSPDLRDHSVARFLGPLLAHLDRAAIEPHLYLTLGAEDEWSKHLRSLAASFTNLSGRTAGAIAERIRKDRIDILIDLAGNTTIDALLVMAHRPAPLQVTYCGYPATTGLRTIDLRFVDSHTDPPPPGAADRFATEKLVRLDPCFLCYEAPRDPPAISELPAKTNGFVTFGSFNSLPKMNEPLAKLWARILGAVPGSRLLLKNAALSDAAVADAWRRRFAAMGVDPARLELVSWIDTQGGHLGAYSRIDLSLDTFPYHGTTTTCESLFMGVPVVTLAGDRHASRVGVSLLSAVGLQECITHDEEAYIHAAASLASNPARLAELRAGLRQRMLASPLMDGGAFAKRFSTALLGQWETRRTSATS